MGVARRPAGQGRFAVRAAAGDAGGAAALRVSGTLEFVLWPAARSGTSPYAGLGLAFLGAARTHGAGYLTAALGLEAAPATARGWYAELGLGGGVHAAVGVVWRRLPAGW